MQNDKIQMTETTWIKLFEIGMWRLAPIGREAIREVFGEGVGTKQLFDIPVEIIEEK